MQIPVPGWGCFDDSGLLYNKSFFICPPERNSEEGKQGFLLLRVLELVGKVAKLSARNNQQILNCPYGDSYMNARLHLRARAQTRNRQLVTEDARAKPWQGRNPLAPSPAALPAEEGVCGFTPPDQ
jgi:hypothetical protein